jgi:hypothetical protein
MNVNDMTAQQAADWCAEDDGWKRSTPSDFFDWKWEKTKFEKREDHPHPLTLDGAAAALPEGWRVDYMRDRKQITTPRWFVRALRLGGEFQSGICVEADDELTARYRLAVACRMAAKEQA